MSDDHFEIDLKAAFAAEDSTLTDDGFVSETMKRIDRAELVRRAVLAFFATLGGVIAGSQLPVLFGLLDGVSLLGDAQFADLLNGLGGATGTSPLILAALGAVAGISVFTAFTAERI